MPEHSLSQDPAFPLRLRALEIKSFEHEGESWLHFHDPSGLSPDAQISQRLAPILALLDGSYDEKSLAAELDDQLGEPVDRAWLARLVAELDELLLIDSPTFREREAAAAAQFEAHSVRPPAFAGRSYAAQPELLNPYLRNLVQRGEALLTAPSDRKYRPEEVRGVVVPHIDFNRGGPEEALAFLPLVDNVAQTGRPYDTLVVLGIAHAGVRYPFCATTKDYETPLGTAACDREFLQDLQDKLGPQLIAEQIKHANEHSVEFVAVFAQYFPQLQRSQLVPIICGGFWEPMREGYSPCEDTQIGPFITALREVTAQHEAKGKKIGFIASVDGAHVGSNFGDDTPLDELRLKEIRLADQDWCAAIEAGDAEGFHAHFVREGERFNVDAHPAVYTLLAAFPELQGQLLAYRQAVNEEENSVVTFASLVLFADPRHITAGTRFAD